jgi:predicted acylesterase/phospholipase RssA
MQPAPNLAVNILRETPPFRNVSLRMLRDLVERGRLEHCPNERPEQAYQVDASLLVVCRGAVRVYLKDPHTGRDYQRILKRGSLHWPALQPGSPHTDERFPPDQKFVARSTTVGTQFISFKQETLLKVLDDVPVLAASLDPTTASPEVNAAIRKALDTTRDGTNHAILLCRDENAPEHVLDALEPLAHLLAESLARQFREPAEVVTFEETERFTTVVGYEAGGESLAPIRQESLEPFSVLDFAEGSAPPLRHVICVEPPNGLGHAGIGKRVSYHRVLYVTARLPKVVPPELLRWLYPDLVENGEAYFSSFVASVLLQKSKPAPQADEGSPDVPDVVWSALSTNGGPFKTTRYDLDGDAPRKHDEAVEQRIDRDSCRLRYGVTPLVDEWRSWCVDVFDDPEGAGTSFAARLFTSSPEYKATTDRWARAVTNRRVGIAMSGGGAASYRLVPVLRLLEHRKVPIDVVGGVSGGALLAAYYCSGGDEGLKKALASAPDLKPYLYAAIAVSGLIEGFINADLGHRMLDDLEVRYVAITATTNKKGRPEAHAIIRGSVGEVVRVSGAAPGLFSPTVKNGHRYSDGTCALAIPARVLKDYGADIVFACNSIPGAILPKDVRNGGLTRWIYQETPYGRVVDGVLAASFLIERLSAEIADDAHGYICSPASENALESTMEFENAADVAKSENMSREVRRQTEECIRRWKEFRKGGRA